MGVGKCHIRVPCLITGTRGVTYFAMNGNDLTSGYQFSNLWVMSIRGSAFSKLFR